MVMNCYGDLNLSGLVSICNIANTSFKTKQKNKCYKFASNLKYLSQVENSKMKVNSSYLRFCTENNS